MVFVGPVKAEAPAKRAIPTMTPFDENMLDGINCLYSVKAICRGLLMSDHCEDEEISFSGKTRNMHENIPRVGLRRQTRMYEITESILVRDFCIVEVCAQICFSPPPHRKQEHAILRITKIDDKRRECRCKVSNCSQILSF